MITVDSLKVYLPQYLSELDQKKLVAEIKSFTDSSEYANIFLDPQHCESFIMQGDCFSKGTFLIPDTKSQSFKDSAPCMILSNTCDISTENKRVLPLNISYAPIFNLEKYQKTLTDIKGTQAALNECNDIRQQKVTSYFYIPSNLGLEYEAFVHFDKLCNSQNPTDHDKTIGSRIFTLNQFGFYLFLFKLSLHFTRMRESVNRTSL